MHLRFVLRAAAGLLSAVPAFCAASDQTAVTIWSWPLSAPAPKPLAQVSIKADTEPPIVSQYTPPEIPYTQNDLVRVGLYDPDTSEWRGSLTSAASFDPKNRHRLSVHVDEAGLPYHVDFASFAQVLDEREERRRARKAAKDAAKPTKKKPKPAKSKTAAKNVQPEDGSQPVVEIVRQQRGPSPHLNAPVVLGPEGTTPDPESEKTFLQKYWWAIAIFLVIQLVSSGMGGGGESKESK